MLRTGGFELHLLGSVPGGFDTTVEEVVELGRHVIDRWPLLREWWRERTIDEPADAADEIVYTSLVGDGRPTGRQGLDRRAVKAIKVRAGQLSQFSLAMTGGLAPSPIRPDLPMHWSATVMVSDRVDDDATVTYDVHLAERAGDRLGPDTPFDAVLAAAMDEIAAFGSQFAIRRGHGSGPHFGASEEPLALLNGHQHHDVHGGAVDGLTAYPWIVVLPAPLAARVDLENPPAVVAEVRPLHGASAGGVALRAATAPAWMGRADLRAWRDVLAPVLLPPRNHMMRFLVFDRGVPPGVLGDDWVDLGPHDPPYTGPTFPSQGWDLA